MNETIGTATARLSALLTSEERKAMHEAKRAGKNTVTKESLAKSKAEKIFTKGLTGKEADAFLLKNSKKAPIKVYEKGKSKSKVEAEVEAEVVDKE